MEELYLIKNDKGLFYKHHEINVVEIVDDEVVYKEYKITWITDYKYASATSDLKIANVLQNKLGGKIVTRSELIK